MRPTQPHAPSARVALCGSLAIAWAGHDPSELRGQHAPLLIAYLTIHLHGASNRDHLIDALWRGHLPEHPRAAFSTLLARTRRALPAGVLTGRSELALDLGPDPSVDWDIALRGREIAARARSAGEPRVALAAAQEALALVDCGFLTGIEGSWVDDRRAEQEALRLPLLEEVARAGLLVGGDAIRDAEHAARAMVAEQPLRERGHLLLMQALVARGDTAEAVVAFDRLRTHLRHELGVMPSAPLRELAEQLLVEPRDDAAELEVLLGARRAARRPRDPLTPEERRVAEWAVTGASSAEIAQALFGTLRFVSARRVDVHLSRACEKLGAASQDELADALRATAPRA